ncbi:hypothetical protein HMPREF1138_1275 [Actinomyces sp. ICM58]|nr:hypothetical protein HMPREF1138_1275 [Actinomyces sp. ICM58]
MPRLATCTAVGTSQSQKMSPRRWGSRGRGRGGLARALILRRG